MDITVRQLTAGDEATACRVAQWLKCSLALQRASRHIDPERTTFDYLRSHPQRGAIGAALAAAALTAVPIVLLVHWNASGPRP